MAEAAASSSLRIGIIGFGPFAQFLVKTMIRQGHSIRATSRSDYTDLCAKLGISFFRDIDGFLESNNDVILLSTSILSFSQSGKDGWKDLSFMYDKVRIRNEATCSSFLQIFASEGCKMMEMTCEEHDELSARSQFLTHTIGRVLAEMGIEPTRIDTKGFEKLVQVKESTSRDSFDLFSGLYIHNRFAQEQLSNIKHALETVKEKLVKRMNEEPNLA